MVNDILVCNNICEDINLERIFPRPDIDPDKIKLVMISEAPSLDPSDYFYRGTSSSFFLTTKTVFQDAGYQIDSFADLENMGIYLTTAIKCSKKKNFISGITISRCSAILEREISQFRNMKVIMCMGDVAIKAINHIYRKNIGRAPIKAGSTYRIRQDRHELNGIRFYPSYTQTGKSFNLEKSKRRMIAEDIRNALEFLKENPL